MRCPIEAAATRFVVVPEGRSDAYDREQALAWQDGSDGGVASASA